MFTAALAWLCSIRISKKEQAFWNSGPEIKGHYLYERASSWIWERLWTDELCGQERWTTIRVRESTVMKSLGLIWVELRRSFSFDYCYTSCLSRRQGTIQFFSIKSFITRNARASSETPWPQAHPITFLPVRKHLRRYSKFSHECWLNRSRVVLLRMETLPFSKPLTSRLYFRYPLPTICCRHTLLVCYFSVASLRGIAPVGI